MASANLELVRSIYAEWERGDYSSTEWAHPEIEFVIADGPAPGSWKGVAGMTRGWRDFLTAWDDVRPEVEDFRELDDKRVLVLIHQTALGKTSGVQVGDMRAEGANLFQIQDGEVTRLVLYLDRERALADLGIEE